MSKILKKVASWFKTKRTSGLEEFITSQNPKSNSDVDRLTQEYQAKYVWARGL